LKQKGPFGVMKVLRSFDFSDNGICQKLERASSLLNNLKVWPHCTSERQSLPKTKYYAYSRL